MKTIYTFLAPGFEEIEAVTPVDLLRRAGLGCVTVGVGGDVIEGAHGIKVIPDITEDAIDLDACSMIILPGGNPGYINLEKSEVVKNAIEYCLKNDRYIAAICAAPSILGHMGILEGKKATVYPGMENELKGADVKKQEVVHDGKIITSRGAGTAIPFAAELIACFKGPGEAAQILNSIVYRQ